MLYRDFATQEAIDAQYDPMRGRDGAAIVREWRERSAATRTRLTVREELAYGPSLAERLDFFPAGPGAPLHVFFHGGYWRALGHKEFSFVAERLVEAGISTAVVNYALCPQVPFSEVVRQGRASLAWLYRQAGELGVDGRRISVSGHSAGGHLGAMLMATDWPGLFGLPDTLLRGLVSLSGLYDLRPFPYSWLQPKLQLTGREVADYSPLFLEPRVKAPVLLATGGKEPGEFARQMHAHAAHMGARGIDVTTLLETEDDHFSILEHYGRPDSAVVTAIHRMSNLSS